MRIETKFDLLQCVEIRPLENMVGRICEISIISNLQYKVRYFHDGREIASWFYEDELAPSKLGSIT